MTRKYFGTDGVRGKVGEYPITPDFVMKLGWAAGKVLSKKGTKKVLIGKDTRISGYMLESALEAGLSAAGIKAVVLGPMPTPAVAYLTRTFRAEAGVVTSVAVAASGAWTALAMLKRAVAVAGGEVVVGGSACRVHAIVPEDATDAPS